MGALYVSSDDLDVDVFIEDTAGEDWSPAELDAKVRSWIDEGFVLRLRHLVDETPIKIDWAPVRDFRIMETSNRRPNSRKRSVYIAVGEETVEGRTYWDGPS